MLRFANGLNNDKADIAHEEDVVIATVVPSGSKTEVTRNEDDNMGEGTFSIGLVCIHFCDSYIFSMAHIYLIHTFI